MLRCACDEEEQCSIAFQRSNDEEDEQRGDEEQHSEEAENVGEGPNVEEEEAELEHVPRQTRGAMWLLLLLHLHGKRIGF
jgi:hypothetical protein